MKEILLAIEILAMVGVAIGNKKDRSLAELLIPAIILLLAHYCACMYL